MTQTVNCGKGPLGAKMDQNMPKAAQNAQKRCQNPLLANAHQVPSHPICGAFWYVVPIAIARALF